MSMESLGSILRRISANALANQANGERGDVEVDVDASDRCEVCEGRGFISVSDPEQGPHAAKLVYCSVCRNPDSSGQKDSLTRYSKLGALSQVTFAATEPEGLASDLASRQSFAHGFAQAVRYADDPQGWLVLTGPARVGKTHLAAAVANHCIENGRTTFFITVPDLLDHLRTAYAPDSETGYDSLFDQVRDVPLLILDGLGVHSATPWAQEKLFQLLNHRRVGSLPTVITVHGPLGRIEESIRARVEGIAGQSTILQLGRFNRTLALGIGSIRPEMLRRMTFDNFDPRGSPKASAQERDTLRQALDAAKTYAQSPEGWLFIAGARGSGKTHLAVAIAGECIHRGWQVFFAFVPTLLDHLRTTYSPNSAVGFDELFEQVLDGELLILDDLGAETSTAWAEEKLYQIIVHRHEARLPTVITTTAIMDELEESKPRLASRLVDWQVIQPLPIDAPNYRDMR